LGGLGSGEFFYARKNGSYEVETQLQLCAIDRLERAPALFMVNAWRSYLGEWRIIAARESR